MRKKTQHFTCFYIKILFQSVSNYKTKCGTLLTTKIRFTKLKQIAALQNLSIYYTWKNIRQQYKNDKHKTIAPTWYDEFELPDGSYSVSDIQDYIQYILKKHETLSDNPPIHIYINRSNNSLLFKIKDRYKLELHLKP